MIERRDVQVCVQPHYTDQADARMWRTIRRGLLMICKAIEARYGSGERGR